VSLARAIAERGHYLSIPANARRSESFTRMLQTLPRERLLLETDCPYLGSEKDGPSEPADVASSAAYAAELWNESPADVEARLAENFARLFGTPPEPSARGGEIAWPLFRDEAGNVHLMAPCRRSTPTRDQTPGSPPASP
jgi:hypothetical protein